MGKFRDFLIKENMGLGDLGSRIDHVFNSELLGGQINGAFTSMDTGTVDQSGTNGSFGNQTSQRSSKSSGSGLPNIDLTIPSVTKEGRITTLKTKKNPIYVRLSDGTEAHFTYDEYRRIQGEKPALGKTMTIIFQRSPDDLTRSASRVTKVIVRD